MICYKKPSAPLSDYLYSTIDIQAMKRLDNTLALNMKAAGWRMGTLGEGEFKPNGRRKDWGNVGHFVEKDLNWYHHLDHHP